MLKYFKTITYLILVTVIASCVDNGMQNKTQEASIVELKKEGDKYQLYVNDSPFYIQGAGLEGGDISELAKHGGNAMRTWRTDNRFRTAAEILDEAHKNGIMVCMVIEIARERHGFDYDDSIAVKEQFDYAKGEVLKYKDHPALLAWGIGNELNLRATNGKVWTAVEDISIMIHEIDPNHPTTTMLAGAHKSVVDLVVASCPSLDFLSFQLYGDIINLPAYIDESGYEGAYVVSEWGATGHWEVAQTKWGRPIEQTSHEKAQAYHERYLKVIKSDPNQCIGSFVFLWGQKQERTPTWYGMFLESGEDTEPVDIMQYLWTGQWPQNRSPQLKEFNIDGLTAYDNMVFAPGTSCTATVKVVDPDSDILSYRWEVIPEVPRNMQSDGGDLEHRPKTITIIESEENQINVALPEAPGQYRLHVYAFDGNNNAATANIPFLVKL